MKQILILFFLAGFTFPATGVARDINMEMAKLKQAVADLQNQLKAEKLKNKNVSDIQKRIAKLEQWRTSSSATPTMPGRQGAPSVVQSSGQTGNIEINKIKMRLQAFDNRLAALERGQQNQTIAQRIESLESAFDVSSSDVTLRKNLKIPSASSVSIKSASFKIDSPIFNVNSPISKFKVINSTTVFTDSLNAKSIAPAAGNIW